MSDPIIGQDCHIILTHVDVNSGDPYGFLVDENPQIGTYPGGVRITHEVDSAGITRLWVYFDVVLSDNSVNPDGSAHTKTRAQDYAMLMQYMAKEAGLELTTPVGTYVDYGALGWTADERHRALSSIVKCQINNVGVYWPPVDPSLLKLSVWDGTLTWSTSYWR